MNGSLVRHGRYLLAQRDKGIGRDSRFKNQWTVLERDVSVRTAAQSTVLSRGEANSHSNEAKSCAERERGGMDAKGKERVKID